MTKKPSLPLVALEIRSKLVNATGLDASQVIIGPPHEAARQQEKAPDKDYLCVFFYNTGYSGFPADAASNDPLYMSAFCLITALGGRPSSGTPTPGESELNLIGAVLEYFHRNPVLKMERDGVKLHIQIVPAQLSLDDINHLWATQNNTPSRLSIAYEFVWLPVPLAVRTEDDGKIVEVIELNVAAFKPESELEGEP